MTPREPPFCCQSAAILLPHPAMDGVGGAHIMIREYRQQKDRKNDTRPQRIQGFHGAGAGRLWRRAGARPGRGQGRDRQAAARTDQAARLADQRLRLLRAVSHPAGREARRARRQAQPRGGLARGAAVFGARARGAGVDRSADLAGRRRQRRSLCAGECGILREGAGLSHVGDRLDQCLEQVRRQLIAGPRRRGSGAAGAAAS